MGTFGAIPAFVQQAITAGQAGALTVEVGGTLVALVPDLIRETPQAWWTKLGGWVDAEGLVTSGRHSAKTPRYRTGAKLNRLRFVESLPGAKVLIWPTEWTQFIYVKKGLSKADATRAVRLALRALGRPPLSAVHSSLIGLGVAGWLHLSSPLSGWGLPHGAVPAVVGGGILAAVAGTSALVFVVQTPGAHAHGGADVTPVAAAPVVPVIFPRRHHPYARTRNEPVSYVQSPALRISPTRTPAKVSPSPTQTHTVPEPDPSSQIQPAAPAPSSSGVPEAQPSSIWSAVPSWWLPSGSRSVGSGQ